MGGGGGVVVGGEVEVAASEGVLKEQWEVWWALEWLRVEKEEGE